MSRYYSGFASKLFKREELEEVPVSEKLPPPPTDETDRQTPPLDGLKNPTEGSVTSSPSDGDSEHLQHGVKQAKAASIAWSKRDLIVAYAGYVHATQPRILSRHHVPCACVTANSNLR
jgi:hypothetical protein